MSISNWQQEVIDKLGMSQFIFYNPREHKLVDSKEYTVCDLFYVESSDIIFAYMEKDNPSGFGLTLEIGYASALGKTIILVDEKSIIDEVFAEKFSIVRETASIVFSNLESGINYLRNLQNGIINK